MKKTFKFFPKRIFYFLRAAVAVLLLIPILIYMLWFNFTVDRAGYFQGDTFVRDIANMLISGKDVSGYEQMDERQVTKLLVQNMSRMPSTVALGSSRILQMNSSVAGTEDFFNFGMVGADYADIFGTFYLLLKANTLPENIIIGFDPWYLNGNEDFLDKRSDKQLYSEFLSEELGKDTDFKPKDDSDKWKALASIGYFQGNVKYYYRDKKLEKKPQPVTGDIMQQATEIKRSDGSVLYTEELRNISIDDADNTAFKQAITFLRMDNYVEPSAELISTFDEMLSIAKKKGINIIFVLQPYNPTLWDNVFGRAENYPGFFKTEAAVRDIAKRANIPVYGSYNPYANDNITQADFFDGIHMKGEALSRIFPGIDEAKMAIEQNVMPNTPDYKALKPKQ